MGLKMSAITIAIVGIVLIVFGILGIVGAGNSEQEVADELAPVTLATLDDTYDQITAAYTPLRGTDSPQESVLLGKKTSLGLARSNVGTIEFVRNTSILEIILGAGLVLASAGLFKRD
jgi:hypothetical protein